MRYRTSPKICLHENAHLATFRRRQVQGLSQTRVAGSILPALHHDAKHGELICANLAVNQVRLHSIALPVQRVLRGRMEVELQELQLLVADNGATAILREVHLNSVPSVTDLALHA
jgi:hypothetical protein